MLANIQGDVKTWMTGYGALAKKYNLKLQAYEAGAGDSTLDFPADKRMRRPRCPWRRRPTRA